MMSKSLYPVASMLFTKSWNFACTKERNGGGGRRGPGSFEGGAVFFEKEPSLPFRRNNRTLNKGYAGLCTSPA